MPPTSVGQATARSGIAVGAGLLIYFLLSMVRTFALKHAQSAEGELTLTHIAGRVIHKTRSTVIAIVAIRMVAGYAQPPAAIMQIQRDLLVQDVVNVMERHFDASELTGVVGEIDRLFTERFDALVESLEIGKSPKGGNAGGTGHRSGGGRKPRHLH